MINFSVIIPNYNHASYLKERIDSILSQTYHQYELIILDDCSLDQSREIIETYRSHPRVSHMIFNSKNSGSPFKQWQRGIEKAKYEWVWIAESDDTAKPEFLQTLARFIEENSSAGLVYANSNITGDEGTPLPFQTTSAISNSDFATTRWNEDHLDTPETILNSYLKKKNIILNVSSAVIKKEYISPCLEEISKMKYYGDWYAYIVIAGMADTGYCHKILNNYHRHAESLIHKFNKKAVKTDCFRILNLLLKQACIREKRVLIDDFVHDWLNVGIRSEGLFFALNIIARYFLINPFLALRVSKRIFLSKFK